MVRHRLGRRPRYWAPLSSPAAPALAMEKIPTEKRGFFSGVLQQGYSVGYLLSAVAFLLVRQIDVGIASWRLLFILMALYGAGLLLLVWRFPETNARRDPLAIRPWALLGNYRMLLTSREFIGQVVLTAFADSPMVCRDGKRVPGAWKISGPARSQAVWCSLSCCDLWVSLPATCAGGSAGWVMPLPTRAAQARRRHAR